MGVLATRLRTLDGPLVPPCFQQQLLQLLQLQTQEDHQELLLQPRLKYWSELWRWQANIVTTIFVDGRQIVVTTINIFFEKNEKNEKCLELSDLARKFNKF